MSNKFSSMFIPTGTKLVVSFTPVPFVPHISLLGLIRGPGHSLFMITIVRKQGNKNYVSKTSLGPGPLNEPAPAPRLDFESYVDLPIEKTLMVSPRLLFPLFLSLTFLFQPTLPCVLCIVFRVDCHPNGVGMPCAHCIVKKLGGYCDHSSNAPRLQSIFNKLQETSAVLNPNGAFFPNSPFFFFS